MIVADTSLITYLLIEGDRTPLARRVWERDPEWRLPPLWRNEFLAVLAQSVQAGVLDEKQGLSAWHRAIALFGSSEHECSGEAVLGAAWDYNIPASDAQFVVLAQELDIPFVTGEPQLLRACPQITRAIEEFAA